MKKTKFCETLPISPMQGKHSKRNCDYQKIDNHLMSTNPSISHYNIKNSPNRLYLHHSFSVKKMFDNFKEKFPNEVCGIETYRKRIKFLNISFTSLENEKCELCTFKKVKHNDCALINCEICKEYSIHVERYTSSREAYQSLSSTPFMLVYTADMQKSLYFPHIEGSQKCLFASQIKTYNLTFAHIKGTKDSSNGDFTCLWHDANGGKNAFHYASAYWKFVEKMSEQHLKINTLVLFLDNCSYQNKNFYFFGTLVRAVNNFNFNKI